MLSAQQLPLPCNLHHRLILTLHPLIGITDMQCPGAWITTLPMSISFTVLSAYRKSSAVSVISTRVSRALGFSVGVGDFAISIFSLWLWLTQPIDQL